MLVESNSELVKRADRPVGDEMIVGSMEYIKNRTMNDIRNLMNCNSLSSANVDNGLWSFSNWAMSLSIALSSKVRCSADRHGNLSAYSVAILSMIQHET